MKFKIYSGKVGPYFFECVFYLFCFNNKRFFNSVALIKIPLLPFALSLETWRWQVMDGRIKPRNYNQAWWDLKMKFQGNTLNPFGVSSLLFSSIVDNR